MKVLSCSDIHLGNYNTFNSQTETYGIGSRLKNRIKAVNDFFEYGLKNNIKHYVFNGDIFDKRQRESIRVVDYIIQNIVDSFAKTPRNSVLYLNVGNHDEQSKYLSPNSLSLFSNINIPYHKIVIVDSLAYLEKLKDNTNLLFIPFTEDVKESKSKVKETLESLDNPTTVFAHLGVVNSINGRYSTKLDGDYTLNDLGWNNPQIKNIVLGHYHTRQILQENAQKKAWYQGNLLPMTFNDVGKDGMGEPRGFDAIDTQTGETQFINLCSEPYNYPKFNVLDYGKVSKSTEELSNILNTDYNKVVLNDIKDLSDGLMEELNDTPSVSVAIKPKINQEQSDIKISEDTSLTDVIKQYCKIKDYSDKVTECALSYIKKVGDN